MLFVDYVPSPKPPLSSVSDFPSSVVNKDGSVCMLIPPGSSSNLRDLVLACDLSDEPSSYCVVVSALIQIGFSTVISPVGGSDATVA